MNILFQLNDFSKYALNKLTNIDLHKLSYQGLYILQSAYELQLLN